MTRRSHRARAGRASRRRELGTVRAAVVLPLDPADAWRLVADVRHHARWIPLTRIDAPARAPGLGDRVTAISGPFPVAGAPNLVDRMRIDRWDPPAASAPGVARYVKEGRVLGGDATIEVASAGPGRSRVLWTERVHLVGPLRRVSAAVLAPALAVMLRLALRRVAREVTGGTGRGHAPRERPRGRGSHPPHRTRDSRRKRRCS